MRVEAARRIHIDEIFALESACFSQPRSLTALEEEIGNPLSIFIAATKDEVVIGYAGMHLICGEGYIDNIAVLKEYRRQGVARELVNKLKDFVTEFLSLEVRQSNLGAIELYKTLGFEEQGKRRGFYTNPDEDGLIFTWYKREGVN